MRGRRNARSRVRGSGTARLTGAGLAVVLAGVGVTAYLIVGGNHGRQDASELPTKVLGTQAIGLVSPGPGASSTNPEVLLAARSGLVFTSSGTVGANWTADEMAGGTYIFIYLPNGLCLGSSLRAGAALQRCDLLADQRWVRQHPVTFAGGIDYYELRNLSDGRCLTAAGPVNAPGPTEITARLEGCHAQSDFRQLIAFLTAS